jgi:tetratricopeptide (TPR) repeat protein
VSEDAVEQAVRMKTLGLVMVVKDSAPIIAQCLDSVKGLVNHWTICDMASTDGTPMLIQQSLTGIPGALQEISCEDISPSRSRALALAKGKTDYHLVLDSNMTVSTSGEFRQKLEADSYLVRQEGPPDCWVERLLSDRHQWKYVGLTREVVVSNTSTTREKLRELSITCHEEQPDRAGRLNREIQLLKESLERGSNVPRATFYLAQAHRDLGNLTRAVEHYEERLKMGGWEEELWYSAYQVGCLQQRLGYAWILVLARYLEAYQLRPARAEPLFRIAKYYRETQQYRLGHLFAKAAIDIASPDDFLFIARQVYEHELPLEYALCCFHLGMKQEAARVAQMILSEPEVPEEAREAAKQCAGEQLKDTG